MAGESTTPEEEELAALFRATFPDGTDFVQVARDDAKWTAFWEPFIASVAPDFVYEDDYLPDHVGETYRGIDGLRRAWLGFVEPFEEMIYELERIVGYGDRFVSTHRVRSKARYSGIVQEFLFAYVWSYRDGKLVHAQGFRNADQALRAAGLEA
jgi:ketosteroid isomerase-like protein